MKIFRTILLSILITLAITNTSNANNSNYDASILIDTKTGVVLHSQNPTKKVYPASLTKLMTLYITFEALEKGLLHLDQNLIVSDDAAKMPASKVGLKVGQKITVREAIESLIVKSANDVATVLSENISGEEKDFAKIMTRVAKEIGMNDTEFKNASGLTAKSQISTAKDMALLGLAIMNYFPQYYNMFSLTSTQISGKKFKSHNNILYKYEYADGLKTGYTSASGYNLIGSATNPQKQRMLGVILGETNPYRRDDEMINLLKYGFYKVNSISSPLSFENWKSQTETLKPSKQVVKINNQQKQDILSSSIPHKDIDDFNGYSHYVQTGAFYNSKSAQTNILNASKYIKNFDYQENIYIKNIRGKDYYRSLFLTKNYNEAQKMCKQLKMNNIDCFIKNI